MHSGVHPHNAQSEGVNDPQKILNQLDHKKIIGIGESGLDFHYDFSEIDCQRKIFFLISKRQERQVYLSLYTVETR